MGVRHAIGDIRTIDALLTTAERESVALGDEIPGAEHLLLAALALPDGTARTAIGTLGLTDADVRRAVVEVHAGALRGLGLAIGEDDRLPDVTPAATPDGASVPLGRGAYRSTPTAQRVFQRAVELSKHRRPAILRGADVVAAVGELTAGTAARALDLLAVDRAALAEAAREASVAVR